MRVSIQLSASFVMVLCLGSLLLPATARGDINGFGDFSNFTLNKSSLDSGSASTITPGKIELTNNGTGELRSIFDDTRQSISQFTASFTYQEINGSSNATQGVTFVLQNTTAGVGAIDSALAGFGYAGFAGGDPHSAAISLELTSPTGTGLYTGGNVSSGSANHTSPVNLLSGDPINVSLSYNGNLLQETLTDSVTSAQTQFAYFVNLPQLLGSATAFVGFTGENEFSPDQQYLSNFQFHAGPSVPEPSSLGLFGAGMAAFCLRRFRRRSA